MPSRRKPRATPARGVVPPEVPEAVKARPPSPAEAQSADADLLPDDLRKMLEAAYT
jgi:hypothetical protein